MSGTPLALIWDLIARDKASPGFLRVAGAADKAATSTERATKSMGGAAARMGTVGKKLTKGATLPLLGIAAVSLDQAAKYQKSLNTIQVATDRNNRQMARGSKGLLAISKETGAALGSLTDSFYVASKSGLSVAKSLKITRAAAQGAAAEGADLGTVTDALTSVMASYGKTLKNPVAAMNEIVKGSGLAKTTTQDFAASLSNVVPIASALGISFDQVAGAIATMTQHGETAQRATDNLSNLITNLAGQNNVAAGALGQLGINTIDLSRNLGKRGLTGSLNLVLDAIAKHSKAGLVVTDAFRQSATATRSLRQELAAMPPALQKQSEAFDKGKLSYKDYYTFVKSLGGQQYQLGKGFIATEGTARGFNQQLKSGNSTTSTIARTLQKALGGVTGMRTALMLSGASAKTFANDTKEIGKAAVDAGADVLGWGKTQATFNNRMARGKASLVAFAVEIGSKLLPAAGKVVDKFSQVVHWFENLSGTQKKIAVWSAGVLFAMGPILSIGSKLILLGNGIGRFATGAGNALMGLRGRAMVMSSGVGAAMRGFTSAIGGAAVGVAVGTLTQNSSTAVKAIGLVASTAAGAAIGFGVGGPIGGAIGGLAGLLGNVATGFFSTGDAAKKSAAVAEAALQREQAAAEELFQTLKQTAGGYVPQARNVVFDQLRQSGLLDKFTDVNPEKLINIALGRSVKHTAAFDKDLSKLSSADLGKFTETQHSGALGERDYEAFRQSQNRTTVSTKLLAGGLANLNKEWIKNADVVVKGKAGDDHVYASGLRNTEVIRENVQQLQKQYVSQVKAGKSAYQAGEAYQSNLASLASMAVGLGGNATAVQTLVNKFGELPRKVQTQIAVLAGQAEAKIAQVAQKLTALHDKTITLSVVEVNGIRHGNTTPQHRARGGFVFGRGTGTSDSIPVMASNGEFFVRARQARKFAPILDAINNDRVNKFAGGGPVGIDYPPPRRHHATAAAGHRSGPVRVTGKVAITPDSQGRLYADFRDIVLDELDFGDTLGRMR